MGELIWSLILLYLGGLIGHVFWRPSKKFGERWGNLFRYAVGYLLSIVGHQVIFGSIREENGRKRLLIIDILTGVTLGFGVFSGHFSDAATGGDK
jgi:hypothetical protein